MAGATARTQQLTARRAHTARYQVAKLAAAQRFYPSLLERCIEERGTATRAAIVEGLRDYFAAAYELDRLEAKRKVTAAKRLNRVALPAAVRASDIRRAAAIAALPQTGASAEENARAAAGHARLAALGSFS